MSVLLPANAQTYSKDPARFPMIPDNAVAEWAEGPYVGIGGTEWIDLVSGMGAVILGHDHQDVTDAVLAQISNGVAFPIPCELDTQVAEQLLSMLTWEGAESVRFGKNGADVTGSAVRIARAVTGKDRIIYNGFHGHHDWSMGYPPKNGGVPRAKNLQLQFPYNSEILDNLMDSWGGPAAVVIEPLMTGRPEEVADPAFFDDVRKICDDHGALLIIDEMVTGFRCAPGGACELYDIKPDLVCYGKAMANGFPLSAIVGPYKHLKRYEEDVFFSTTHGGEAVSLAAALATMKVVQNNDVPALIAPLGRRILEAAGPYGFGYPQRPVFTFSQGALEAMGEHRVLCGGYANLTLAHVETPGVGDAIVAAVEEAREVQDTVNKIIAELDAVG